MMTESQKLTKLVEIFNQLFLESENTSLQTGADEPFYRAATQQDHAIIFSRENFYSSALHEIAHWCIAGAERRKLDDFGYWYKPEGRNELEQAEFEKVEVKPQAIEWALSLASDHTFHFSADNLSQEMDASETFKQAVFEQLKHFLESDLLPQRAKLLFENLNLAFRAGQTVETPNV